jgi:hypothetical protein
MESNDRMHFQNDKEIEKLIPFELGNYSLNLIIIEPILYSEKIQKVNRWNLKQERILVLTFRGIYLFRKKRNCF